MARESFDDPDTATIMNERLVNVKVDREERPDIDAIPAGRCGEPSEFADVGVFLVRARASYVAGRITGVDGGFIRSL